MSSPSSASTSVPKRSLNSQAVLEEDEYTAAETYVAEMKKKGSTDYFPIGRSICIPDDGKSQLEEEED